MARGAVERTHARNLRITPEFFVKSWQALPTAAFRRGLAPSVSSFNSTSRHGSGGFLSTSSTLRRPISTQRLVCSGEPLWISKRRPFLARPEHGVLSVECNLVTSSYARD